MVVRHLVGVVLGSSTESQVPANKLKAITEVLDTAPVLTEDILSLCRWASGYYQHPIGEAVHAALPALLRKGASSEAPHERCYCVAPTAPTSDSIRKKAPRQAELLQLIIDQPQGVSHHHLQALGLTGSPLKAVLEKGWVVLEMVKLEHPEPPQILAEAPLALNPEQREATTAISAALEQFQVFLLAGVTGSGKTEVYLQVIEQVLEAGGSALVLVPEIGLTPQTITRFRHRFTTPVAVLHSGLTDHERLHAWHQANSGEAKIILGTRSAVFTSIKNLAVIIIDEEHDGSFKQQDGLRYSARDIAVMRARNANIPIVLGSATPSLESLHNCQAGRYQQLALRQRAGDAAAPGFKLIDIRARPLDGGLSQPLVQTMREHLAASHQVLVFINRRGFAPTLMCHECGWQAQCVRCDARYTLHLGQNRLHCHHCDSQRPIPPHCPECNHSQLTPMGHGTERSEEAIRRLFPDTQVLRVDRDSTRNKHAMQDLVGQINQGQPCILVGTQMLAKGHHFPKVTLVAILDADSGLFSADFRGLEKMGQLILQVSGRAGRSEHPGEVVIQTHQPEHPVLHTLVNQGYQPFAHSLLAERQAAQLPPYTYMAVLRAEAVNDDLPYHFLNNARDTAELLPDNQAVIVIGPIPAIMAKRAGRHRAQLLFQSDNRKDLHNLLQRLAIHLESLKEARKVRWSLDIDPVDMY